MRTIIVDDRQLIVNSVIRLLQRIVPGEEHNGFTDPEEALEFAEENTVDIAFLDVEMPMMNGLELAKELIKLNPVVNIIFITGHTEYAMSAHELYATAYIIKPVTEEALRNALSHLRFRVPMNEEKKIKAQCFGAFEVFFEDKPIKFARNKTKELFAYLIDQRGAMCTLDMIYGNLWPDDPVTESKLSLLRTLIADLRNTLDACGCKDVIVKERTNIGVDVSKIDCDYFKYLDGDPIAVHQFRGDYMTQYSFAEFTRANLQRKFFD